MNVSIFVTTLFVREIKDVLPKKESESLPTPREIREHLDDCNRSEYAKKVLASSCGIQPLQTFT